MKNRISFILGAASLIAVLSSSGTAYALFPTTNFTAFPTTIKESLERVNGFIQDKMKLSTIKDEILAHGSNAKGAAEFIFNTKTMIEEKAKQAKEYVDMVQGYAEEIKEYKRQIEEVVDYAKETVDDVKTQAENIKGEIESIEQKAKDVKAGIEGIKDAATAKIDEVKDRVEDAKSEIEGVLPNGTAQNANTKSTTAQNPSVSASVGSQLRQPFTDSSLENDAHNISGNLSDKDIEVQHILSETPKETVDGEIIPLQGDEKTIDIEGKAIHEFSAPTNSQLRQPFTSSALESRSHISSQTKVAFALALEMDDDCRDINGTRLFPKAACMYCTGYSSKKVRENGAADACILKMREDAKGEDANRRIFATNAYRKGKLQAAAQMIAESYRAANKAETFYDNKVAPIAEATVNDTQDALVNLTEFNRVISEQLNDLVQIYATRLALKNYINYQRYDFKSDKKDGQDGQ